MKRIFDFFLTLALLILLFFQIIFICIAIKLSSKGAALYWSNRVGKNNKIFKMPKFRSMVVGTPNEATHLLSNPGSYLSPISGFLRLSSLDELPLRQLLMKAVPGFKPQSNITDILYEV